MERKERKNEESSDIYDSFFSGWKSCEIECFSSSDDFVWFFVVDVVLLFFYLFHRNAFNVFNFLLEKIADISTDIESVRCSSESIVVKRKPCVRNKWLCLCVSVCVRGTRERDAYSIKLGVAVLFCFHLIWKQIGQYVFCCLRQPIGELNFECYQQIATP